MAHFNRGRALAPLGSFLFVASALMAGTAYAQAPAAPPPAATPPVLAPDQQPTPRDAAGHPILVGFWNGSAPVVAAALGGIKNVECNGGPNREKCQTSDSIDFQARGGTFDHFEEDGRVNRKDGLNKPVYKPEYWDLVQDNDYWANWRDPADYCVPFGVPRLGAPTEIEKVEGKPFYEFFYSTTFATFNTYRMIPTDARPHNVEQVALESYNGDSVGHWDGDTLVIETIGFTDNSWLSGDGWIHGFKMKVTERLTRKGNTLTFGVTVEDPEYLQQPYVIPNRTLFLNNDPNAILAEALPCDSRIGEPWGTEAKPTGSHVH
jgi:hypothetical protein